MNQKNTLLLLMIIAFILGGIGGWYLGNRQGHAAGIVAANEKLKKLGIVRASPQNLKQTRATVMTPATAEHQSIRIEMPQAISNPLETQAPTTRTVRSTKETALLRRLLKARGQYARELDAYRDTLKKLKQDTNIPVEPSPFTEEPIYLTDIKQDDAILVDSAEDFLYKETFDASQIIVVTDLLPK